MEDEARIAREQEELKRRERDDIDIKSKQKNEFDAANLQIIEDKRKRALLDQEKQKSNKNTNLNNNCNNQNNNEIPNDIDYEQQRLIFEENQRNLQNTKMNNQMQEDLEIKRNMNNEILKLQNNVVEVNNAVMKELVDLKAQTVEANLHRFEALKEINNLKQELCQQRADEELRRKYLYDTIADNHTKVADAYSNTKLPDLNFDDHKVNLNYNYDEKMKEDDYDFKMKHPNKIKPNPNLYNLNDEQEFKVESKFIDLDNHQIIDVI